MNNFYNDDYNIRKRNVTIGESEFDSVLIELVNLQKTAQEHPEQQEFKLWLQLSTSGPMLFNDYRNPSKSVVFESNPMGLVATIKREDLLNFNVNDPIIKVTFKEEDLNRFNISTALKGFKGGITPPPNYVESIPQVNYDINTEITPDKLENLYTNMTKVKSPLDHKYSFEELELYAELHGPYTLWQLMLNLSKDEWSKAETIFIRKFGNRILNMFANKNPNSPEHEKQFMEEFGSKYSKEELRRYLANHSVKHEEYDMISIQWSSGRKLYYPRPFLQE